jgi:hypothetical protein
MFYAKKIQNKIVKKLKFISKDNPLLQKKLQSKYLEKKFVTK